MEENVAGLALELPNNQNPEPYAKAKYGTTPVPHPTNEAAKKVNHKAIVDSFTK